jgi:tripartite-type tricarboxylate transporter receptor subunit TctC
MSVYQHVYKSLAYDPIGDFQPVAQVATFDFGLAVGPQVPAKTLKELVDWVKANPAQGSYGTPAAGTLPHFFAVSFAKAAGLDLRHVGYRGSAGALTDLVAGQVPIVVTTTSDLLEQHKAQRIRVLATSDTQRSPFLPDVPTFRRPATTSRAQAGTASSCRPRRLQMSSSASTRPLPPLCRHRR